MRHSTYFLSFALLIASNCTVEAQVTEMQFERIDNSAVLTGYVTNDLLMSLNGQYSGSELILELTEGEIYQDPLNNSSTSQRVDKALGRLPPSHLFIPLFPSIAFDTFVAYGELVDHGVVPVALVGAVDIGGAVEAKFDTTGINLSWGPSAGHPFIQDAADVPVARITLSDDARGSFIWLNAAGGQLTLLEGHIVNGIMGIPEPGTLFMCVLGSVLVRGIKK